MQKPYPLEKKTIYLPNLIKFFTDLAILRKTKLHIDGVNNGAIIGWVYSDKLPVNTHLSINGEIVSVSNQCKRRPDVVSYLGLHDGGELLGFSLDLSPIVGLDYSFDDIRLLVSFGRSFSQKTFEYSKSASKNAGLRVAEFRNLSLISSARFVYFSGEKISFIVTLPKGLKAGVGEASLPSLWGRNSSGESLDLGMYSKVYDFSAPEVIEKKELLYQIDLQCLSSESQNIQMVYLDNKLQIPALMSVDNIDEIYLNDQRYIDKDLSLLPNESIHKVQSLWRICLPFYDDSTLIFQSTLKNLIEENIEDAEIVLLNIEGDSTLLSKRQLETHLAGLRPFSVDANVLESFLLKSELDVVIDPKPHPVLASLYQYSYAERTDNKLPRLIGFFAGIDFNPVRGIINRYYFDSLFLFGSDSYNLAKELFSGVDGNQYVPRIHKGHPYLVGKPNKLDKVNLLKSSTKIKKIYFFAQAISPSTFEGRLDAVKLFDKLAANNPDKHIVFKLRNHSNEQTAHEEEFSYSNIIDSYYRGKKQPSNISISAASFESIATDMDLCITCTSTVALQSLVMGINTMVFLDYIDSSEDPLNSLAKAFFSQSNIISSKEDICNLVVKKPNSNWLHKFFSSKQQLCRSLECEIKYLEPVS